MMEVVTMYRAAKIAGVSKQAIFDLKKRNADGKSNYSFFCFDPKTGKHGIDINDIEWKRYLDRGNKKNRQGNKPVRKTKEGVIPSDQGNDARFKNLMEAVFFVLKKTYSPSAQELEKLTGDISKRYEGMVRKY